ncbi:MAG: thymidylate synthase [Candidatus Sungbacteria bacterium]|uniref:Thymidylate synthase n=1 Tax=Candidatus Sungiibacteriota bacterium TaxID=2750080 RepID=A0A9D6LSZ9_9BACT|nr:thymidylate synthase [Candidatus Sungbacteria bacterium]
MVRYVSYGDREPDRQYRNLIQKIIESGKFVTETQMGEGALRIIGNEMRFDFSNGFPVITERDLLDPGKIGKSQFEMAIAELCAFLNGARTLDEMKNFGCGWWAPWVTEEKCKKRGLETGDLGPGSYGAAWRAFPTMYGAPFDQWKHVLEQMAELPHLRTHIVTPFIPQYIGRGKGKEQKVVVVPCHGLVHIFVDAKDGELSLLHWQRSADAPVGLVFNLIQYAALTMMLAQVFGYRATELVFQTSDTHIYAGGPNDQRADVRDMLETEPQRLPTVTLDPDVKDLFAFRPHHFHVEDYHAQLGRRRIKTPV